MEHIAGEMFEQLNKCLTGNDNITYGTKPSTITITNGESAAITTLGGTLQLTTTINSGKLRKRYPLDNKQ